MYSRVPKNFVKAFFVLVVSLVGLSKVKAATYNGDIKNITVYTKTDAPVLVTLTTESSYTKEYYVTIISNTSSATYTATIEQEKSVKANLAPGSYTITYAKKEQQSEEYYTQTVEIKKITITYPQAISYTKACVTKTNTKGDLEYDDSKSRSSDQANLNAAIANVFVTINVDGSTYTITESTKNKDFGLKINQTSDKTVATLTVSDNLSVVSFSDQKEVSVNAISSVITPTITASSTNICYGATPVLTLSSGTGSVTWQSSINNVNFNTAIIGATYTTTYFRAVTTNTGCGVGTLTSDVVKVEVSEASVAGTISGTAVICAGASPNLSLLNSKGVVTWYSKNGEGEYSKIETNDLNKPISSTTYYKARVKNGGEACTAVETGVYTVTVDQPSVAGTISGTATICAGSDPKLTLSENQGMVSWLTSTNGTTFVSTGAPSNNLTATTYYKASSKNGGCSAVETGVYTVTVDQPSVAGTISGTATICAGSDPKLTLSENLGIVTWLTSTNETTFVSTDAPSKNLTATTYYKASVKNGVCSAVETGVYTVTVDQPSVAGTISGTPEICINTNTTLSLTDSRGNIVWKSKTNNTDFKIIDEANAATYTTTNLNEITSYVAVVTNGVCNSATSGTFTVTTTPNTEITSNIITPTAVCAGTVFTTPLTVTASGTGTITYQWYSNNDGSSTGIVVSDAKNSSFTPPSSNAGNVYYYVIATGKCLTAQSRVVKAEVFANPLAPKIVAADNANSFNNNITLTAVPEVGTKTDIKNYTWIVHSISDLKTSYIDKGTDPILILNLQSPSGTYNVKLTDGNGCISPYSNNDFVTMPTLVSNQVSPITNPIQANENYVVNNFNSHSVLSDGDADAVVETMPLNYVMESATNELSSNELVNTILLTVVKLGLNNVYSGKPGDFYVYDITKTNSNYTLLAYNQLSLAEKNIVEKGSIGMINSPSLVVKKENNEYNQVKLSLKADLLLSETGAFIKVPFINSFGVNANFINEVAGIESSFMPVFPSSTKSSVVYPKNSEEFKNGTGTLLQELSGNYKNITLRKGTKTRLTGNSFGTVKVEQGAIVIFSPASTFTNSSIYIADLEVAKGPINGATTVDFEKDVNVYVSEKVNIASNSWINPAAKKVVFYVGKPISTTNKEDENESAFTVTGGKTIVNASVYIPSGTINVAGGYAYGEYGKDKKSSTSLEYDEEKYAGTGNEIVKLNGLFIANKIYTKGKNITWSNQLPEKKNIDPSLFASSSVIDETMVSSMTEDESATVTEDFAVTVAPNPSSYSFTLKITSKLDAPIYLIAQDYMGNAIETISNIKPNTSVQIGQNYRSGTYYIQVVQNGQRKLLRVIKI